MADAKWRGVDRRGLLGGAAIFLTYPGWAMARGEGSLAAEVDRAFDYAYPLFEFSRAMQRIGQLADPGLPLEQRLNRIYHRRVLADANARQVTAPNNDTIYSSAFFDLSGGPLRLRVPDITDRYFSVTLMSAFTDNFRTIGTRATAGRGGDFWLVGPDWKGAVPAGAMLVRSETNDVWMLIRILVASSAELPIVTALQDRFTVIAPPGRGPIRAPKARAADGTDASQIFDAAVEMLSRSSDRVGQARRWRRFAASGIRPGGAGSFAALSPALQTEWRAQTPPAVDRLRETFTAGVRQVNGWGASTAEVGAFSANDRLRAAVALSGLAALPSEEAMYFSSVRDNRGAPLEPGSRYRIRIPAEGIPVDGFWSITMYAAEPDGRYFFVDNPIHRYSVSERTPGLIRRADGAIDIILSRDPINDSDANWLPTPNGPMRVSLRAYIPRAPIREGRWAPPAIERL